MNEGGLSVTDNLNCYLFRHPQMADMKAEGINR